MHPVHLVQYYVSDQQRFLFLFFFSVTRVFLHCLLPQYAFNELSFIFNRVVMDGDSERVKVFLKQTLKKDFKLPT